MFRLYSGLAAAITLASAQSFIGTVDAFKPDTLEILVKSEAGEVRSLKITAETIVQRVAPGERDLKNAISLRASDVALGDRVLVSIERGTSDLRRLVVMAASDLSKRDDADRADWQKRGVTGVVASKNDDAIVIKSRSTMGESDIILRIRAVTTFRRYAPDSVRFADAKSSSVAEISPGDQVRARGERGPDQSVSAEEVVFGTFVTKAGKIVSIDPQGRRITLSELGSSKTVEIRLTPESQIKKMPAVGAEGPPVGAPGAGGPPGGGRPLDLGQMLERLPKLPLDQLRIGETVVLSSTRGMDASSPLTAIMVVSGAEMLLQMARAQQPGRNGDRPRDVPGGSVLSIGGLDGFPSFVQ